MLTFQVSSIFLTIWCCMFLSFALGVDKIPDDFRIGFASSAYQYEGAWNEDGKGPSIWDTAAHANNLIWKNQTGDIACDSYHKYKEDVQMLKNVGAKIYRFSLSWPRILPTGYSNKINKKGVQYYNNLINELLKNNIEPLVTIFHWDLPQTFQDFGGWTNPILVNYYADYARLCFQLFGDRVKLWTTFNEPMQICEMGYGSAMLAPAIKSPGIGDYLCGHTLLKAHATAYHIYDKEFRKKQNGSVSIVTDFTWHEPADITKKSDIEAADMANEFYYGWFIHPVVYGDYPEIMRKNIDKKSAQEGFSRSRLPIFTLKERILLRGSYDFLGVNIYIATLATTGVPTNAIGFDADMGINSYQPSNWQIAPNGIFSITPWSARKILNYIKDKYNNPILYVTENGLLKDNDDLEDTDRIEYIKNYLKEILNAKVLDKVDVRGYTGWSLMDDLEWASGYQYKFGIYKVDFNSPNRTRTPRQSANYVTRIIETKCLEDSCV